ncbi:MAG: hypothetical protein AAF655_04775 [Bacteroidota bacterium]
MKVRIHIFSLNNFVNILISLLFISFLVLSSCTSFHEEAARAEILTRPHLQRGYHFEGKEEPFAGMMSGEMISVNRGVVSFPTY